MITDGDRGVRLAAAAALHAINDPKALAPLLEQITREQDPDVRAALTAPLASIGDLQALPVLRTLLRDPYTTTAAAAAIALRELGPTIREKAPTLKPEIADELREIFERTPPGPGTLALRESLIEAMVPLRSQSLMQTFYRLLQETSSVRIRWAALRALGELGDPKSADTIARYIEDRESGVRLEAIRALGRTSAAEHASQLYRRLNPAIEPDANVREEAWKVLEAAFPRISLEQLPDWASRFPDEPARRLAVLRAMMDGYTRTRRAEPLAAAQQRAGVAHMELAQPAEAVILFKASLELWQKRDPQHVMTERRSEQYLQSLLRARQYPEAVRFAGELVKNSVSYQQTAGVNFRDEAQRLQKIGHTADCLALIEQIRKMSPPLAAQYQEVFDPIEQSLRPATTQEVAREPAVP
jgi:HEAT repeat protein